MAKTKNTTKPNQEVKVEVTSDVTTDTVTTNATDSKKEKEEVVEAKTPKKDKPITAKIRSKKYHKVKSTIDKNKLYDLLDAVKLVQSASLSKFDGKIDAHFVTSLDPGTVGEITFPYLETAQKKIVVATPEVIKQISEGVLDFDILVATPVLMPKLLPLARILGPKGLMPNPKNGTLSANTDEAVKKLQAGKTIIKTEKKAPLIHITVGKVSQKPQEIVANLEELIKLIKPNKITKLALAPSMGPSVKVKIEK